MFMLFFLSMVFWIIMFNLLINWIKPQSHVMVRCKMHKWERFNGMLRCEVCHYFPGNVR